MKSQRFSWEIVLAGIVLTALVIYLMDNSDSSPQQSKTTYSAKAPEPPEPPQSPESAQETERIVIDFRNLQDLQKLEQLKHLGDKQHKQIDIEIKNLEDLIDKEQIDKAVREVEKSLQGLKHFDFNVQQRDKKIIIDRSVAADLSEGQWNKVADGTYMYRKTTDASDIDQLDLDLAFGKISIIGSDSPNGELLLSARGDIASVEELNKRMNVSVKASGKTSSIAVESKKRFSWFDNVDLHAELTIPKHIQINANTSGGHLDASNLKGNHKLETSGGHITLDNLEGDITAETMGGHINCTNLTGSYILKTMGGHIEIDHLEGSAQVKTNGGHLKFSDVSGHVSGKTSGGNISATFVKLDGPVDLATSAGNIKLVFPKSAGAELDLRGSSVYLDDAFKLKGTIKEDRITGTMNGGGPTVSASCSFGSVSVKHD